MVPESSNAIIDVNLVPESSNSVISVDPMVTTNLDSLSQISKWEKDHTTPTITPNLVPAYDKYRYKAMTRPNVPARVDLNKPILASPVEHNAELNTENNVEELPLPEFVEHQVKPTDTLQGILLRYQTNLRTIKKFNDFPGKNFRACENLTIPSRHLPPGWEPPKLDPLHKFTSITRANSKEAKYYLHDNDNDLDAAIAAYKSDMAWENQHAESITTKKDTENKSPGAKSAVPMHMLETALFPGPSGGE